MNLQKMIDDCQNPRVHGKVMAYLRHSLNLQGEDIAAILGILEDGNAERFDKYENIVRESFISAYNKAVIYL